MNDVQAKNFERDVRHGVYLQMRNWDDEVRLYSNFIFIQTGQRCQLDESTVVVVLPSNVRRLFNRPAQKINIGKNLQKKQM
jgi:hypothetical protein